MTSQAETEQPITATLRIYLLGSPEAEWAGESFSVFRRQARALLYHLAGIYEDRGDYDEAERLYQRSVDILEQMNGGEAEVGRLRSSR